MQMDKVGNGSYHLVHRKCIPGRCSRKLAVKVVPLVSHLDHKATTQLKKPVNN